MNKMKRIYLALTDEEVLSLLDATSPTLHHRYHPSFDGPDNDLRKKVLKAVTEAKESQNKHIEVIRILKYEGPEREVYEVLLASLSGSRKYNRVTITDLYRGESHVLQARALGNPTS